MPLGSANVSKYEVGPQVLPLAGTVPRMTLVPRVTWVAPIT